MQNKVTNPYFIYLFEKGRLVCCVGFATTNDEKGITKKKKKQKIKIEEGMILRV